MILIYTPNDNLKCNHLYQMAIKTIVAICAGVFVICWALFSVLYLKYAKDVSKALESIICCNSEAS
jgi:hypothetical protein